MALVARTTTTTVEDTGYAVRIDSGRHHLTADEPVGGGGTDTGPSPFGLLLAGLGSCTAITLRMYGDRKGWDLGLIEVDLDYTVEDGAGHIDRRLRTSGSLTDDQRDRLLEIAGKTPVTRAILAGTPISTTFA